MTENWYNNKDIFERLMKYEEESRSERNELQRSMQKLANEMTETRALMVRYNNLIERLYKCEKQIDGYSTQCKTTAFEVSELYTEVKQLTQKTIEYEAQQKGRMSFAETIRQWTPWGIVIITILYYASKGGMF